MINNEPDGTNINTNCGSTHINVLQEYVKENGLDVGFAYDGDADRCIAVDENGNVYVGETAQERRNLYPDSVAQAFKRSMGTDRTYDLSGKKFRPEELSSMILRYALMTCPS